MSKKELIWLLVIWMALTVVNYYYMPFYYMTYARLVLLVVLIALAAFQITTLIKERGNPQRFDIVKAFILILLLALTVYSRPANRVIEKIDWHIFYTKRKDIVDQVRNKKLNPGVSWHHALCKLSFKFPEISNGGNDILIFRNKNDTGTTVSFWAFRSFYDGPSIYFTYSDDPEEITHIEKKIKENPANNWQLSEHWYRTFGDE
jgi:hypothetical protein